MAYNDIALDPIIQRRRMLDESIKLKNEQLKQELLNNPEHANAYLAQLSRSAMTDKDAAKMGKNTNLDKALLAIPEDDPRRKMFAQLSREIPNIIKNTPYGTDPSSAILNAVQRSEEAIKPEIYNYIKSNEGWFGKKVAPAENQQEYLEWVEKNPSFGDIPKSAITGAGIGAGLQGLAFPTAAYAGSMAAKGYKFAKPLAWVAKNLLSWGPSLLGGAGGGPGGAVAGKLLGSALVGALGFGAEKLVETAAAKAGHPMSTLEKLAVGFPIWMGTSGLAKAGGKYVGEELASMSRNLGSTAEYNGVRKVNEFVRRSNGKLVPKPAVTIKDLQEAQAKIDLTLAEKAAQDAKIESYKKLSTKDLEEITLHPENEDAIRKAAFARNAAEDAAATAAKDAAMRQDIVDRAAGMRETNPGMTAEESLELARRKINPNALEAKEDLDYLRDVVGMDVDTLATMSPMERAIKRSLWEQHSNSAGTKALTIRDEILPPAVPVSKLTNPIIRNQPIEMGAGNYKPNVIVQPIKNATERAQEMLAKTYDNEIPFAVKQGMPNNMAIDENASSIFKAFKTDLTAPSASSVISTVTKTGAVKTVPKIVPKVPAKVLTALEEHANLIAQTRAAGEAIAKGSTSNKEKLTALGKLYSNSMREVDLISAKHRLGNDEGVAYKRAIKRLNQDLEGLVGDTTAAEKIAKDELDDMVGGLTTSTSAKSNLSKAAKAAATEQQKKAEWNTITGGGKVTKEDLIANKNGIQEKIIAWQKKWKGQLVGAAVGVPALVTLGSIFPSPADAAPIGNPATLVPGGFKDLIVDSGKAVAEMVGKLVEAGYGPPKISADGHAVDWIMRSMSFAPKDASVFPRTKPTLFDKFLSPHMLDDIHLNAQYADNSRAPFGIFKEIAYKSQTILANTDAGLTVTNNILKDAGVEQQLKEISDLFEPLVAKYHKQVNLENPYWNGVVETMDNVLAGKYSSSADTSLKKLSNAIRLSKGDLSVLDAEEKAIYEVILKRKQEALGEIDKLKPVLEEFNTEYEQYARTAAERFSTSRVAYATEKYGMSPENNWLEGLLSPAEKKAAEEISALNTAYAVRMKESGHEIISGPYIHHPAHPSVNYAEDLKHLGIFTPDNDEAMRLVHFFHRSAGSKLMIPDTHYIMAKYLPDANKRIEISELWKNWEPIKQQMQAKGGYEGALSLLDKARTAFDPMDISGSAKWLNRYAAFEVARLLTLSPSVSFKHALKLLGNWTIFPGSISAKATAENFGLQARQLAQDVVGDFYRGKDNIADLSRALTHMHHTYAAVSDMAPYEVPVSIYDNYITKINKAGSAFVNMVERFDRGQTFISSMMMAQKRGMTPEQAMYGLMDSVLRVNFLTGPNNPKWLKDPFIRTMMMFQGTPFKILEQRMMTSYKGGKDVLNTLKLLGKLKDDIKTGEANFKWHMLNDELTRHKDVFGNNYSTQFLKQLMVIGTVIYSGKKVFDADLWGHAIHVPGMQLKEKGIQLGVNPIVSAAYQTATGGNITPSNENDFALSRFWQSWLGQSGFPAIARKIARLSDDDIPAIYKESKLSYLFGVPKTKEKD
jgi:hypothetical protein